jgi:hypothetical protein
MWQQAARISDAAVICDTEMFAHGLPAYAWVVALFTSTLSYKAGRCLRGVYGGAALGDRAIANLCALAVRATHSDTGFIVECPPGLRRAAWERLPFDEEEYSARMEVRELVGARSRCSNDMGSADSRVQHPRRFHG